MNEDTAEDGVFSTTESIGSAYIVPKLEVPETCANGFPEVQVLKQHGEICVPIKVESQDEDDIPLLSTNLGAVDTAAVPGCSGNYENPPLLENNADESTSGSMENMIVDVESPFTPVRGTPNPVEDAGASRKGLAASHKANIRGNQSVPIRQEVRDGVGNMNSATKEHDYSLSSFPCQHCSGTFISMGHLKRHLEQRHKIMDLESVSPVPKLFSCNNCDKTFAFEYTLKRHIQHFHNVPDTGPQQQETNTAEKRQRPMRASAKKCCFDEEAMAESSSKSYDCDKCGQDFYDAIGLRLHRSSCAGKHYPCTVCGKKHPSAGSLKQHMKSHATEGKGRGNIKQPDIGRKPGQIQEKVQMPAPPLMTADGEVPEKKHVCEQCGRAFFQAENLQRHMISHSYAPVVTQKYQKVATPYVQLHQPQGRQSAHGAVHLCDRCGKQFSQAYHLQEHMKTHTAPGLKFQKGTCNLSQIPGPVDDKDSGHSSHLCDKCGEHFPKAAMLEEHITQHGESYGDSGKHHENEKTSGPMQYMCDTCGQQFALSEVLERHLAAHCSDKDPESSELLSKRSITAGEPVNGKRNIGSSSRRIRSSKQRTSKIAGTALMLQRRSRSSVKSSRKGQLRRHACAKCNKGFTFACGLRQHMRQHNKWHACRRCNRRFCEPYKLKLHMTLHHETIACVSCRKVFASTQESREHLLIQDANKAHRVRGCATNGVSCGAKKWHTCQCCEKKYGIVEVLRRHMRVRHREAFLVHRRQRAADNSNQRRCVQKKAGSTARVNGSSSAEGRTSTYKEWHYCLPCNRRYGYLSMLALHKRMCHSEVRTGKSSLGSIRIKWTDKVRKAGQVKHSSAESAAVGVQNGKSSVTGRSEAVNQADKSSASQHSKATQAVASLQTTAVDQGTQRAALTKPPAGRLGSQRADIQSDASKVTPVSAPLGTSLLRTRQSTAQQQSGTVGGMATAAAANTTVPGGLPKPPQATTTPHALLLAMRQHAMCLWCDQTFPRLSQLAEHACVHGDEVQKAVSSQ